MLFLVWQGCLQTFSSGNVMEHPEKILTKQLAVVQKSKQPLNANLSWLETERIPQDDSHEDKAENHWLWLPEGVSNFSNQGIWKLVTTWEKKSKTPALFMVKR